MNVPKEITRVLIAFADAGIRLGSNTYLLCRHLQEQEFQLGDVNVDVLRAIIPKLSRSIPAAYARKITPLYHPWDTVWETYRKVRS